MLSIFSTIRLKVAAVDVEQARTEKAEWEKVVVELRKQCTTLEEEKYEALDKVKVYAQAAKNAELEMAQVPLSSFSLLQQQFSNYLIWNMSSD